MDEMPKVSIIMPAYNVENFIQDSILSIRNQTYENWELLIINDGSTDDTLAVSKASSNRDKRIQIYSQPNKGVSAARNLGLFHATGSLIAFLDGDDLWHPSFLGKMVSAVLMRDSQIAFSGFNRLHPDGSLSCYNKQYKEGAILLPILQAKVLLHIGSILVSKAIIEQYSIRFTEDCMISEDMEFMYKLLAIAETVVVKEELMTYRKRIGSTTQNDWKWKPYITSIYAMERVLDFINKYYIHADKDEVREVLQDLICYLKCDFLWKGVKFGEHVVIRELIAKGWRDELRNIHKKEKRISKRIKYKIVLSENPFLWSKIYKMNLLMQYSKRQFRQ